MSGEDIDLLNRRRQILQYSSTRRRLVHTENGVSMFRLILSTIERNVDKMEISKQNKQASKKTVKKLEDRQ